MEMVGKKNGLISSKGMLTAMALIVASAAGAETFTFELASPVASQDFKLKMAAFVFRPAGCGAGLKPELNASAEGLVEGKRQAKLLQLVESTTRPGVYAVPQPFEAGRWVVVLKGTCGAAKAGAIVPIKQWGFVREASQIMDRFPSSTEIEGALKAFPEGGYR